MAAVALKTLGFLPKGFQPATLSHNMAMNFLSTNKISQTHAHQHTASPKDASGHQGKRQHTHQKEQLSGANRMHV